MNYVRIHNKKNTDASWSQLNPVLLDGEIIIVSLEGSIKFKVGDGITHYVDLPFLNEDLLQGVVSKLAELEKKLNDRLEVDIDSKLETKLDNTTSPENIGKILSVDSEGNIVFRDIDLSGQNVTLSSVIGLTEALALKADLYELREFKSQVVESVKNALQDKVSRDEFDESLQSHSDIMNKLGAEVSINKNKVEDLYEGFSLLNTDVSSNTKKIEELAESIENLDIEVPAPENINITDVIGLSEVLTTKADDSEVKDMSQMIDSIQERLYEIDNELATKLPSSMPLSEVGKVMYVDESGNLVPKEIQFSEGGSGGTGGILTWGDLIGIK